MTLFRVVQFRRKFVNIALIAGFCAIQAACTARTPAVTVVERQDRAVTALQAGSDAQLVAGPEEPARANWLQRVVARAPQAVRRSGGYKVGKPYQIAGRWYQPQIDPNYDEVGAASWYGGGFHGRVTANGEIFDANALSAAHPTLPLPTYVRVTNLENDRSVVVRVNDRGPYAHNRLIDVSQRTAELLGFKRNGEAKVRVQYVDKARLDGKDQDFLLASYRGPEGDLWRGAGIQMASAGVERAGPAVPTATVESKRRASSGERVGASVAFAAEPKENSRGGEGAFEAVTTAYDPGNRITMAFEMASQAEY